MKKLTKLLKPLAIIAFLMIAPAMLAQTKIIRPVKVAAKPSVTPVNIVQAPTVIKEKKAKLIARQSAKKRRTHRPNVTITNTNELPPLQFNTVEMPDNTPRLNPERFTAPRPEARGKALAEGNRNTRNIGNLTVTLPESITIFEEGPDFLIGGMENVFEINAIELDSSYKIHTPEAYTAYIKELYGGLEQNNANGNRTELSGYDTKSSRNYRVAMVADGDKLYVARLIYSPSVERQVTEIILPSLLVPSSSNTTAL
ncbi:MAG: hypothetical protein NC045_02460 [Bacteroides sp.]|nr:hypothetical protein [Bacteroides sp.]